MKKVYLHGEAMIFPSKVEEGAEEINPSNGGYHIIADSEVTGNHHVVDTDKSVKLFRKGNKTFMVNTKETNVRCLIADRHTAITIEPGTWEFGIQQEFDHIAQNLRNVAD